MFKEYTKVKHKATKDCQSIISTDIKIHNDKN